jgi:hypothetical protein
MLDVIVVCGLWLQLLVVCVLSEEMSWSRGVVLLLYTLGACWRQFPETSGNLTNRRVEKDTESTGNLQNLFEGSRLRILGSSADDLTLSKQHRDVAGYPIRRDVGGGFQKLPQLSQASTVLPGGSLVQYAWNCAEIKSQQIQQAQTTNFPIHG